MNIESILKQLVSINSIFPREKELGEWLEKYLKTGEWQIKKHYVGENRFNLLAEKGEIKPAIGFYGHLDTVPAYGDWKTDPFKLTKKGDRLYGLGACDMKAGIVAMLMAVLNHKPEGRKIKLFFGVDEENISLGAHELVKKFRNWFSDMLVIYVPESGHSKKFRGGADVLTLGRRGRVVFQINVFGKSAHGATPDKGINAISQAAEIVKAVDEMRLANHSRLGRSSAFVRLISGQSTSLSLPDNVAIEVDRHLVVPETTQSALKQLCLMIGGLYKNGRLNVSVDKKARVFIKKRQTPYLQPFITDRRLKVVKQTKNIIKGLFGKVNINYALSAADENVLANLLKKPVITIGPRGNNEHSANESVSLKSIKELVQVYKQIIREIY